MLGTIVRVRKTQKGSRHEQRTHQPSHRSRFERLTPESPRLCRGIFTVPLPAVDRSHAKEAKHAQAGRRQRANGEGAEEG
jgi:hypothetical protein